MKCYTNIKNVAFYVPAPNIDLHNFSHYKRYSEVLMFYYISLATNA